MNSDYAFLKLQGINGDDYFIKKIPVKLSQQTKNYDIPGSRADFDFDSQILFRCSSIKKDYGFLYFDAQINKYIIIAFTPIVVDDKPGSHQEVSEKFLAQITKTKDALRSFDDFKIPITNNSKLYFPCSDCDIPHVFYVVLPQSEEEIKNDQLNLKLHGTVYTQNKNVLNPHNKVPDRNLPTKWSIDDKEQLKKYLLIHGYGRWKKIQEASRSIGGKLYEKPIVEIRAFANSFLRAIAENLGQESQELKNHFYNIVEELPTDPYIAPNAKDWDISSLKQRAVPWGKRIQLLYRIRILIKKFKEEALKNIPDGDKNKIQWDNMLNFLPDSMLYGQKPQVWWTKKHDIDLLRGIYKYGYANYQTIRNANEFSFRDLEKTNSYQDFPSSDTITRRLKKLIQTVMKNQLNKDKLTFEMSSSGDEIEGWSLDIKQALFKFLQNYGMPLNTEGRTNWVEFKEKFLKATSVDPQEMNRSVAQIEKMVQKIRMKCQQIITNEKEGEMVNEEGKIIEEKKIEEEEKDLEEDFKISYEEALKFSKNENMLHFIRKSVLHNNNALFKSGLDELKQKNSELDPSHPAYVSPEYSCETHDLGLLLCVVENGFNCVNILKTNPFYEYNKLDIDEKKLLGRLEFVCEFFKNFTEKSGPFNKKRKAEKSLKDPDLKKKTKFLINRDTSGNIIFPIQINNSLTLLNTGTICTNPNYHSEHNLFPIGYSSIRVYNSMRTKGVKCEYVNEILEGPEGKPLYRVTPSEDPENPIIKESSTGCWVYICSRVNDLQDVKKEKVTISGTERFGLLDQNIVRLLEDLPNSEKCMKYNFKFKVVTRENDPFDL